LTAAREDHLTEFLAAALDVSKSFRAAYIDQILGDFAKSDGSATVEIQDVKTQVSFPGTTCCPDMLITLSNGRTVACEHKLDALETMGPERDQRSQLKRYLDLPVDGLLYVRTLWKPPGSEVVNHPKYIHPPGREHFLWRDFYPLFSSGTHIVLDWLREGFERLGFTPPHPSIGEMSGPNEEMNLENRRNFAKLWQSTKSTAHALGWKIEIGSIVELYLSDNSSSLASSIFISPAKFERFLFRVTPYSGKHQMALTQLQQAAGLSDKKMDVEKIQIRRTNGKEDVVDVTTTLREIVGTGPLSPEDMEARLLDTVEPLLKAVLI
jgi:hypothetical protein